jgi:hypothetical protein
LAVSQVRAQPSLFAVEEAAHRELDRAIGRAYFQLSERRRLARSRDKRLPLLASLFQAVNRRFGVFNGLDSLTLEEKKDLLKTLEGRIKEGTP